MSIADIGLGKQQGNCKKKHGWKDSTPFQQMEQIHTDYGYLGIAMPPS
jgi:hypothetical protein